MTRITKAPFGVTGDGRAVTRYTMENETGMIVRVLDYCCTIQGVVVPDRDGRPVDVALGYDDMAGYEAGSCWFGAFVGRYANRIGGAAFTLNGKNFTLPKNDGANHLHGTFERRVFAASAEEEALVLRYESPDGEEGFPGALSVTVTYALTAGNTLRMEFRAVTDADTVVNLINHTYFHLSGAGNGDILDHILTLDADRVAEIGAGTLPTGRLLPVEGTAFDFREAKPLGRDIFSGEAQLVLARGYDHHFVRASEGFAPCARAHSPASGITLTVATTQPGLQLYTGNFVDGDAAPRGKGGVRYPRHGGFALETQHFPDSPNQPGFPSTVLRPGEEYKEVTEYRFTVE